MTTKCILFQLSSEERHYNNFVKCAKNGHLQFKHNVVFQTGLISLLGFWEEYYIISRPKLQNVYVCSPAWVK